MLFWESCNFFFFGWEVWGGKIYEFFEAIITLNTLSYPPKYWHGSAPPLLLAMPGFWKRLVHQPINLTAWFSLANSGSARLLRPLLGSASLFYLCVWGVGGDYKTPLRFWPDFCFQAGRANITSLNLAL